MKTFQDSLLVLKWGQHINMNIIGEIWNGNCEDGKSEKIL